jgi:hypothetical protein
MQKVNSELVKILKFENRSHPSMQRPQQQVRSQIHMNALLHVLHHTHQHQDQQL